MLVIELVQLISAAIGMALCGIGIYISAKDVHDSRLEGHSSLHVLAGQVRRRREIVRFIKHTLIFMSGIIVVNWRMTRDSVPQSWEIYYLRNLTLTFVSVLMMLETIWEQYDRWVIGKMVDAEYHDIR